MQRDYKAFLEDIIDAIAKIEKYIKGMTFEEFEDNELAVWDIIKNKLPDLKNKIPTILEREQ